MNTTLRFPQILGVYQPVLEGEALVIKEATPEWRRITPHERFCFHWHWQHKRFW